MWRAFFLAIGVTFCILGLECMVLDKAVLASGGGVGALASTQPEYDAYGFENDPAAEARIIEPPDWAPWSLMSTGSIVLLYSLTRRIRGE